MFLSPTSKGNNFRSHLGRFATTGPSTVDNPSRCQACIFNMTVYADCERSAASCLPRRVVPRGSGRESEARSNICIFVCARLQENNMK